MTFITINKESLMQLQQDLIIFQKFLEQQIDDKTQNGENEQVEEVQNTINIIDDYII